MSVSNVSVLNPLSTLTCEHPPSTSRRIRSPLELKRCVPMTETDRRRVEAHRRQVREIVHGRDDRLLVVVGPCSIHHPESALEYAARLQALSEKVADRLLLVMRAYFEKPRTTIGWKGYALDPLMDGSHDMDLGLERSRKLLADMSRLGLPLATEALSPVVAEYLQDWVSWTAIGARTTESQTHRELASSLDAVVGFKNATDGGVRVAIDAIKSASHPHDYLGVDHEGRVAIRQTPGNPNGHIVLRGAIGAPNYDAISIARCRDALHSAGLKARILVDCSHDNCAKDYRKQPVVLNDVAKQIRAGNNDIMGVMLESHIKEGQQKMAGCPTRLDPQQSVTDGCMGWEVTARLIEDLRSARD